MTKYRLIERNDGTFQIECKHNESDVWILHNYNVYEEEDGRNELMAIKALRDRFKIKRVVDEIEV